MKFIMISYVEAVEKIRKVLQKWHIRYLQIEASPKKIHRVEKDLLRFVVKLTTELGFDLKDPLPSATWNALGKETLCRVHIL